MKSGVFWAEIRIFGLKKTAILAGKYVLATTGQSCARKKYQQSFGGFRVFFLGEKRTFWPIFPHSGKTKIGCFSVILARTRLVVNVGHSFGGPDGSTKLRWLRSKIKGTYTSNWGMAKIRDEPWKITPTSETDFFGVGNFFLIALGVLVICPFDKKSRFQNK